MAIAVAVGLAAAAGRRVDVAVGRWLAVRPGVAVGVGLDRGVLVALGEGVRVAVPVVVWVGVTVGSEVLVRIGVGVRVAVLVGDGVDVAAGEGVAVGVGVEVLVGVWVGLGVAEGGLVGVDFTCATGMAGAMLVTNAVPVMKVPDQVGTDFGGILTAGMGVSVDKVTGTVMERVGFAG
jgi:hypothetical protein